MLKRHLGDLAWHRKEEHCTNTAEWSDNKIGNIDIEELDEIKDGLRNYVVYPRESLVSIRKKSEVLSFSILNSP